MLDSIYAQLDGCLRFGLICRNVPAATSATLRSLGLNEYEVRYFWEVMRGCIDEGYDSITVLKYRDVVFKVGLTFKQGSICFIPPSLSVDEYECRELNIYGLRLVSNSNILYVYVKGYLGGDLFIKVNGVYLLKKLADLGEFKTMNVIKKLARRVLEGGFSISDLHEASEIVRTLRKFSNELRELMIYVPLDLNDMLRHAPALHRYLGRRATALHNLTRLL